jgi:hypothetical protein
MLSATPHSGDDAAFARLCSLGDCGGKFPLVFFRRTKADAGMRVRRRTRWLHVRPTAAEAAMTDALVDYARRVWVSEAAADPARLAMIVLLRRASSSAAALARSLERRLASVDRTPPASPPQLALPFADPAADDDEPWLSVAAPGLDDAGEERRHLERVLSLAKVAAIRESKIAVLERWLRRVAEPVVIFTEYRDTLVHLKRHLTSRGLVEADVTELHGGLTRTERLAASSSFTSGHAHVLLATDAASEGLNLHHRCRCVINLESPWSPVRLEQRIGRVDRIGQRHCVHAITLVGAGTHETTTVRRLIEREQRAAGALRDPTVSDMATASSILTGIGAPAGRLPVTLPASLLRPDLSSVATAEAAWITTARRLGTTPVDSDRRPLLTALHHAPGTVLWVVDLPLDADAGEAAWTSVVALRLPLSGPGIERRFTKAVLATLEARMTAAALELTKPAAGAATAALWDAVQIGVSREQAICAAIRVRHARIAADLLQPGLFDRRAERGAAAQAMVLEDALAQCQDRLQQLARLAAAQPGSPRLRFAVLL